MLNFILVDDEGERQADELLSKVGEQIDKEKEDKVMEISIYALIGS